MTQSESFDQGYAFPWSRPGRRGGRSSSLLKWESLDPRDKTWVTFLAEYRDGRSSTVPQLCAEYGISETWAKKVYRRYRRWQATGHVGTAVDPVAALRKLRSEREATQ